MLSFAYRSRRTIFHQLSAMPLRCGSPREAPSTQPVGIDPRSTSTADKVKPAVHCMGTTKQDGTGHVPRYVWQAENNTVWIAIDLGPT